MRILLVTGSFPPLKCGVGDYTAGLASELGNDHEVAVGVLAPAGSCVRPRSNTLEILPIIGDWRMSESLKILSMIRKWRPDIVHFQFPTQGYRGALPVLMLYALYLLGHKIVHTWHEYLPKRNLNLGIALLLMSPGNVIVVKPDFRGHMTPLARLLVRRKKFWLIPNAASLPCVRLTDHERKVIRERFIRFESELVAYFGFIYPHKGVDQLLDLLEEDSCHLVIIGDIQRDNPFHRYILDRLEKEPWRGRATVTGFLPGNEVASILAASDAVVLPFREGAGPWNTSLQGAMLQGTFVLTTSKERHGYDESQNVYYAKPGDIQDMKQAMSAYLGKRRGATDQGLFTTWHSVAAQHLEVYRSVLTSGK